MLSLKSCAALAACVVLAACASLSPQEPVQRAPAFDLLGRVAVNYDGRAFSSGVRWQHEATGDEIFLLTPVGQTIAHIVATPSGATLTGADRKQIEADDVESLTRRGLGWELPLSRLAWWVRGAIVPGGLIGEVTRDDQGRLARLMQDGWIIVFVYRQQGDSSHLPQRLDLTHEGHQIRLVIDSWRASETP
ncbi:MAG TPA: lipoprotein insertase outer membrane protein LolB [Burkholderiales bacterium]|nr:lipoprotein insertase outer membrane protein LolB [Burkholderiales bacterium]